MSEKLRVCRKCLPRTETREEYFEKLSDYVKRMDEDLKVDQETYEKRLALCTENQKMPGYTSEMGSLYRINREEQRG